MRSAARRIPALLRRGGRSPVVSGGGVAPTITVAPVLTWTGGIGSSPVLTDPVYTGDPGTITWTYYRDGVPDGTINGVNKATAEAYVAAWSGTTTGVNDNAVSRVFRATVTNGSGSDFADSNAQTYDDSALPIAAGTTEDDLVLADGDTTIDQWGSSIGSIAATITAPVSSARFAYSATGGAGGRPLATSDGSADRLRGAITRGSNFPNVEIGVVARLLTNTGTKYLCSWGAGTWLRRTDATALRVGGRTVLGGVITTTSNADPMTYVSADGDAAGCVIRVAGASESTGSGGASPESDGAFFELAGFGASTYCAQEMQGWVVGARLTTGQRLDLRALLTARTGIAC